MRSLLRASQVIFAVLVLLIATVTFFNLPQPYPHWPSVGPVPINPELIVPGLLGLTVIFGALGDGLSAESVGIGVLGVLTMWLAATSLYTLYSSTGGGVFWGGFMTLISGVTLSIGVIIQSVVRQKPPREILLRIHDHFGE